MAKGQKRSGREPKKPKAKKPVAAATSIFNRPPPPKQPAAKSDKN